MHLTLGRRPQRATATHWKGRVKDKTGRPAAAAICSTSRLGRKRRPLGHRDKPDHARTRRLHRPREGRHAVEPASPAQFRRASSAKRSNGSDVLPERGVHSQGSADCLVGLVEIGGVNPAPFHKCHVLLFTVADRFCDIQGNREKQVHQTHQTYQTDCRPASRLGTVAEFFRTFVNCGVPVGCDHLPAGAACRQPG